MIDQIPTTNPAYVKTADGARFASRTGGAGHEVTIKTAADGSTYLTCSCPGGQKAFVKGPNQGRGCWAMQTLRQALGLPAIGVRSTIARA